MLCLPFETCLTDKMSWQLQGQVGLWAEPDVLAEQCATWRVDAGTQQQWKIDLRHPEAGQQPKPALWPSWVTLSSHRDWNF